LHTFYRHQDFADGACDSKIPLSLNNAIKKGLETSWNWECMIEEYAAMKLSNPTDKLPAISAAAEMFGKIYLGSQIAPESYRVGLWKQHMPFALLWYRNDPQSIQHRLRPKYRAPT
jgi:hypothetical protein